MITCTTTGNNKAASSSSLWPPILLGLAAGVAAKWASTYFGTNPSAAISNVFEAVNSVGIAAVGLIPLTGWLIWLIFTHLVTRSHQDPDRLQEHYAFISRTAPVLGLLGTFFALAVASSAMAGDIQISGASAVLQIMPMIGQALISTLVGIALQLFTETILHFCSPQPSKT